jgi:hypothetical protein
MGAVPWGGEHLLLAGGTPARASGTLALPQRALLGLDGAC